MNCSSVYLWRLKACINFCENGVVTATFLGKLDYTLTYKGLVFFRLVILDFLYQHFIVDFDNSSFYIFSFPLCSVKNNKFNQNRYWNAFPLQIFNE